MKQTKFQIPRLSAKIKSCTICTQLVKTRIQSVPGYGDIHADVFIIGEAPGRLGADQTGVPFTQDKSGIFLQKLLCNLGLNLSPPESTTPTLHGVFITNIVKCNPQSENKTNRPPSPDEISNCSDYLQNELDIIKPRLVVPLGLPASRYLLGKGFNGRDFGKIIKKERFHILPLWHPAFIIRGGGSQKMNVKRYSRHFAKIKKFIKSV